MIADSSDNLDTSFSILLSKSAFFMFFRWDASSLSSLVTYTKGVKDRSTLCFPFMSTSLKANSRLAEANSVTSTRLRPRALPSTEACNFSSNGLLKYLWVYWEGSRCNFTEWGNNKKVVMDDSCYFKMSLFYSTTAKRRKTWYTKKASLHSSKYKKIQF